MLIVTETLTKGVLIAINTSKESTFYGDFKTTIFILDLPTKSCKPEKICRSKKRQNNPRYASDLSENYTVKFRISENPMVKVSCPYLRKCEIMNSFSETNPCFFSGVIILEDDYQVTRSYWDDLVNAGPKIWENELLEHTLNVSVPFKIVKKNAP